MKKSSESQMDNTTSNDTDIIVELRKSYKDLSPKLQIVAKYVIDYPYDFTLSSLSKVSSRLNLPQSTIVRLAKFLGFNNGQDFHRAVSKAVISNFDYSSRLALRKTPDETPDASASPESIMQELIQRNISAMRHMQSTVSGEKLQKVVDSITEADTIYLNGVRRVFPLMLQMRYGLSHFHKKVFLIGGLGGMFREEADSIDSKSLLFTVSYYPYSPEPIDVQKLALEKKAKNILVTDSELHPLFDSMNETVIIRDAELHGVRTLSASMTFVHSVVIGVGSRLSS